MSRIRQLPPILLAHATCLRLQDRVHFVKDCIGDVQHSKDEDYEVFRKVVLAPSKDQPEKPGAILIVRFRFTRFGGKTNRLLSLIPIPFIIAQPGFRAKTWLMSRKTETFRGLYEWDSIGDAEKYLVSFPMKLMRRRAIPETLTHEIRPA
jgi:hypothetical protein